MRASERIALYIVLAFLWICLVVPVWIAVGWWGPMTELGGDIASERFSMNYERNSPAMRNHARHGYERAVAERRAIWLKMGGLAAGSFIVFVAAPLETINYRNRRLQRRLTNSPG